MAQKRIADWNEKAVLHKYLISFDTKTLSEQFYFKSEFILIGTEFSIKMGREVALQKLHQTNF